MKKALLYFFLVFLISCSSEEYKNEENFILPKTLSVKLPESSDIDTTNFIYNGNKIMTASRKFRRSEYLYNGDKIVKETKYSSQLGKEEKISETTFTYENNKLIFSDKIENKKKFKYLYIYKEDGTIIKEEYEVNFMTGKEVKTAGNEVLVFVNGNLVKQILNYEADSFKFATICVYNYDKSNNAFKNVLGFDFLLNQISFDFEGNLSSINNLKKIERYSTNQLGDIHKDYSTSFNYEYNSKGYPVKKTSNGIEGTNEIIEYKY